jgi:hypothetical protein
MICSYQFFYMHISVFITKFYPHFFAYVRVQSSTLCNVTLCIVPLPPLGMLILYDVFSRLTFEVVYIRYLLQFVITLLHDTVFVVPCIVLQLFHSWSLLSNLPSTAIGTSLLHYKLSVYTANTAVMNRSTLPFFFKDSPHHAFVGFVSSFLCQCLHLIGLILVQHLLFLFVEFIFG